MSLDDPRQLDAIGVEIETGHAVLTIADSWPWNDEKTHLLALQSKLNAYLELIQSGQLDDCYPLSPGRQLKIHVVFLYGPQDQAHALLAEAAKAAAKLNVLISQETFGGKSSR
jgi:hypothetical protein